MWSAVNRVTASGKVLGAHERISAYDALHAAHAGRRLSPSNWTAKLAAWSAASAPTLPCSLQARWRWTPLRSRTFDLGTVVGGAGYMPTSAAGSNVQ